MKTLNITFEDTDFEKMRKVKDKGGYSWHDFILQMYSWWTGAETNDQ